MRRLAVDDIEIKRLDVVNLVGLRKTCQSVNETEVNGRDDDDDDIAKCVYDQAPM